MSQYVETPTKMFTAGAAIAQYLRVILSSGKLAAAGAHDEELGTLEAASFADLDVRAVRLRSAQGTVKMVAAAAVTAGNRVYGAASGKVDDVANGNPIGIAIDAATADGDVIEVLRLSEASQQTSTVEAKTADYTVTTDDSGKTFSTKGAGAAVTFAMPAAVVGLKYRFYVGAAQELRIDPNGTETISLPSTGVAGAAGKYLTANAIGETVEVECCEAGTWAVYGFTGTWTAEA